MTNSYAELLKLVAETSEEGGGENAADVEIRELVITQGEYILVNDDDHDAPVVHFKVFEEADDALRKAVHEWGRGRKGRDLDHSFQLLTLGLYWIDSETGPIIETAY